MKHIELMAECVLGNIRVLERLLDTLPQAQQEAVANIVAQAPVLAPPAPVAPSSALVVQQPVLTPPPAPAPVVAAPVVAAPVVAAPVVAAPVVAAAPFTTPNEMIAWVTTKWRTLGPVKGAEIQTVVQSLGFENINELTPDKYAELYAKVEAL